ncbi:LysR family transcriptional regulator [Roseomonas sp. PWR1]|uniref:LysR family transcriptional regulator n=1 Tax=Roseomonas nitratireducens TaxID=2820810 RepID=A0ABS4AUP0_9PROT|nr:LysR substrate-binding domain-containing protein [Neoroseomonas nitratireducens]MBP0465084.1 LysR family transcriptional regulator [Neoroseomonas nitratireducens]
MLRHLPLSALRAFEAATRTGSFRAAAAELALTPSAVSHAIRGLEENLGVALFRREGRSIQPTVEGERLAHHVARGFGELRLGLGAVTARGTQLLRLHAAPSFAAQWLVPRLSRLLEESPGLELRVAAGTDYPRFLHDEFDADIIYGAPSAAFYGGLRLVTLPLGTEVVTPLCAPALASRIRDAQALMEHPLIDSTSKKVRWTEWFAANGLIAPEPRGPRFDRSFLSLRAAEDGLGVALESTLLAERELAEGRLVRPLLGRAEDVTYTGHYLVFPEDRRYARGVRRFAEWLAKELAMDLRLDGVAP